jgi:hypothetical protein
MVLWVLLRYLLLEEGHLCIMKRKGPRRNKNHFHRPFSNFSCFQKVAYYAGIKIYNSLSIGLKIILDKNDKFKLA